MNDISLRNIKTDLGAIIQISNAIIFELFNFNFENIEALKGYGGISIIES